MINSFLNMATRPEEFGRSLNMEEEQDEEASDTFDCSKAKRIFGTLLLMSDIGLGAPGSGGGGGGGGAVNHMAVHANMCTSVDTGRVSRRYSSGSSKVFHGEDIDCEE